MVACWIEDDLPKQLWPYALKTSAYIRTGALTLGEIRPRSRRGVEKDPISEIICLVKQASMP